MLKETDAAEFIGGYLLDEGGRGLTGRLMPGQPLGGGKDGVRAVVGEEVANNLGPLCYEETLTATELLLFQLADELDLVFGDRHGA